MYNLIATWMITFRIFEKNILNNKTFRLVWPLSHFSKFVMSLKILGDALLINVIAAGTIKIVIDDGRLDDNFSAITTDWIFK